MLCSVSCINTVPVVDDSNGDDDTANKEGILKGIWMTLMIIISTW